LKLPTAAIGVAGKPTGEIQMTRTQKSRPTHSVFVVEGEGDSAFWTKIGAAWSHEDGEGYNITLTATPMNGRLVVRTAKITDKPEAAR
jgi:hypothetical protein